MQCVLRVPRRRWWCSVIGDWTSGTCTWWRVVRLSASIATDSEYRRHRIARILQVDSIYSSFARAADLIDPLFLSACLWGLRRRYTSLHVAMFVIKIWVAHCLYMVHLGEHSSCSCCITSTASQRRSWSDREPSPSSRSFTDFSGARLQEIRNNNQQHKIINDWTLRGVLSLILKLLNFWSLVAASMQLQCFTKSLCVYMQPVSCPPTKKNSLSKGAYTNLSSGCKSPLLTPNWVHCLTAIKLIFLLHQLGWS